MQVAMLTDPAGGTRRLQRVPPHAEVTSFDVDSRTGLIREHMLHFYGDLPWSEPTNSRRKRKRAVHVIKQAMAAGVAEDVARPLAFLGLNAEQIEDIAREALI